MIDTERSASTPVLAQDLRLWRIKRNLSQEEAVELSGVSCDKISRAGRATCALDVPRSIIVTWQGSKGQPACR